jgi:hypothetical protein
MQKRNLLKQILQETRNLWDIPGTPRDIRRNLAAIVDCGTAVLGWELFASSTEEKRVYHTCKSRFCPSCGVRDTLQWLAEQEAKLPEIPYRGIVLTMPRELWGIFKTNRHLLHDLPTLGAAVVQQWMRIKHHVRVLIIVVPQTFGGDLKFNTHLHILISAGGLSESHRRWIPSVELNKTALMKMWRYAVITHLRSAIRARVLTSRLERQAIQKMLTSAYEPPVWNIVIDEVESKSHFLRYAARYVRRPPIASWRLLRVRNGEVIYLEKHTKLKRMVRVKRSLIEFVRLLVQHVPQKYRHSVRYFGLLAPRTKANTRSALYFILGHATPVVPARLSWRNSLIKYFDFDPLIDSHGEEMRWIRSERLLRLPNGAGA